MKISTLVDKRLVAANLRSRTKEAVLAEIVRIVCSRKCPVDPKVILDKLLERESTGSTGIGSGVAIPHARLEKLAEPVLFVGVSKMGVDFDAIDDQPVQLILLFLTPVAETGLHLQILSQIGAIARNELLRKQLIAAQTDGEMLHLLRDEQLDPLGFLSLSAEEIGAELGTSPHGLSSEEAKKRLAQYGRNRLKELRKKSALRRFLANFTNLFAILLWLGAILSFVTGMAAVAWAIIAVIFFNGLFSFWQEHRAEQALAALSTLLPQQARVIRDGKETSVHAEELVPGDVILFEEGDSISADARLIESAELRVDSSVFSGESRPGYKIAEPLAERPRDFVWTELPNLVFAGTNVVSGTGRAIVFATGMATEVGKIAYLTQVIGDAPSPLQLEISRVSKVIALLAAGLGIFFLIIGAFAAKMTLAAAAIFAIGIIVANVPEGLLPTVTLSLAVAVQRMTKRHVLVKKLSSVETLGSTTVICSDKTGTLTTNQISVEDVWIDGRQYEVSGATYEPKGELRLGGKALPPPDLQADPQLSLLMQTGVLCSTARLLSPGETRATWAISGDPTEAALLVLAAKAGIDLDAEREAYPLVRRFPFDSVRKRMSSIHRLPDGRLRAFVKGAPAQLLDLSSRFFESDHEVPLSDDRRQYASKSFDTYASQGLRILGMAYRDVDPAELQGMTSESLERDLTFLGFTAMRDPPRPGVAEAVAECHRAGIRVVMITGDFGLTAVTIAHQLGIVSSPAARVVTGDELRAATDDELKEALRGEVVFARASPEHKLRIVSLLQELGNIVAVTGDGVNDAPALKKADIGVAMGLRGTDVARQSAEMVLTDDNFGSIVAAIEEGRAVFANIRKFITYIFAHLVPEAIPFILYAMVAIPVPITVLLVLAIDLGTETLPALALGVEKPEPGVMDVPPRSRKTHLVDRVVLGRGYGFLGVLNAIGVLGAFFFVLFRGGWSFGDRLEPTAEVFSNPLHLEAMTAVFTCIVVMQIANLFATRSEDKSVFEIGIFGNRLIWYGLAFEMAVTLAIIYVPALQRVFGTAPLDWEVWVLLIGLSLLVFFAEELRKWLVRRRRRHVRAPVGIPIGATAAHARGRA